MGVERNEPHPSYRSRPGVLFIAHRRPTIFEQCLVIPTASLPWWKPQMGHLLMRSGNLKPEEE